MKLFGRAALMLALFSVPAFACQGGIPGKSPENPSVVLGLAGSAVFGLNYLRAKLKR